MIKNKIQQSKVEIDLTGPQGNAFFLIGTAKRFSSQLGQTKEEYKEIEADMTSADYEHLISVFEKHFGDFVVLYR